MKRLFAGLVVLVSVLGFLVVTAGFPTSSPREFVRAQEGECSDCENGDLADYVMVGTYYQIRDFKASLILNNKGPEPLPVAITFFSMQGNRLDFPRELEGNSAEEINLNDLLGREDSEFQEGSIQINYQYPGCQLVLSAGIILTDTAQGLAFDELFTRLDKPKGNRLESLWWVPTRRSRIDLVLSNTSDDPISAVIKADSSGFPAWQKEASFDFQPRETKRLKVPQRFLIDLRKPHWKAGSLTIEHTGQPGDLVARGYVWDRNIGFSNVMEFSDPLAAEGTELHGTGLRFTTAGGQRLIPVVVARNTAETESILTVRVPYTTTSGEAHVRTFEKVVLEFGEVRNLAEWVYGRFNELNLDEIATAGLEVRYSTDPGTVLVSAFTVSLDGNQVFRVPLVDPLTKGSAGNYPWRLDESTTTYVYLKNTSRDVQKYTVQVDTEGRSYVLGLRELRPGETFTLDLRELRDSRQADEHGTLMPPDAVSGQVHWSVIGSSSHTMVGRAEYVDELNGLSSTFACSSCCPDSYYTGYIDPADDTFPYDASNPYSAFQRNKNCYGTILSPFGVTPSAWFSSDSSVATVGSNGLAYGVRPGSTWINGQWSIYIWYFAGPSQGCRSEIRVIVPFGGAQVIPRVSISGPLSVPVGTINSVQLIATGSPQDPGGTYEWSVLSGGVGLQGNTQAVNVVSYYESSSPGDVTIQVIYRVNSMPSLPATHPMTAQKPTRIRLLSGGSTGSASCSSSLSGPQRIVTWQVLDRWGDPIQHQGMPVSDIGDLHINPNSNGCLVTDLATGPGMTGPSGTWSDTYHMCSGVCYSSPPCTTTATQYFTINSFRLSTDPVYISYQCSTITFPNKE